MINSEPSSILRRSSAAVLLEAAPFLFAACGEQPDPYVMADFNGMTLKEADTKLEQVALHAKGEDRSGKNRRPLTAEKVS